MGLKEDVLQKLADIDCKDKIKATLSEHSDDIARGLYLDTKEKGALDAIQEKVICRQLLVFAVATALLWYVGLDADTWGMIAMTYIGGQTAIDFAKVWKGGSDGQMMQLGLNNGNFVIIILEKGLELV